jgi:hypothetical protein
VVPAKMVQESTHVYVKEDFLGKIVSVMSILAVTHLVKMAALVIMSREVITVVVNMGCMDSTVNGIRMTAYRILVKMAVLVLMATKAIPASAKMVLLEITVSRV